MVGPKRQVHLWDQVTHASESGHTSALESYLLSLFPLITSVRVCLKVREGVIGLGHSHNPCPRTVGYRRGQTDQRVANVYPTSTGQ